MGELRKLICWLHINGIICSEEKVLYLFICFKTKEAFGIKGLLQQGSMHLQSQNGRSDLRITSGKEQLMAVF